MEKNNPIYQNSKHKTQIIWQIWFPLILGVLMIIALATLAVLSSNTNAMEGQKLASISLIVLIIPFLIFSIILIAFLAAFNFGIFKLTQIIPIYSMKVQFYAAFASDYVRLWSDRVANPVVFIQSWLASFSQAFNSLSNNIKKQ